MKKNKLIDAIGDIKDEYIQEAHTKQKKLPFNLSFSWPTVMKLAAAGLCILLAVTILPKMFYSSKNTSGLYEKDQKEDYAYSLEHASYATNDEEAYGAAGASIDPSEPAKNTNKKLILTANLNLETQNIDDLTKTLKSNVQQFDAYFQHTSTYTRSSGTRVYEATIRIPADKYSDFVNNLQDLGNLVSYSEEVEDVTDSYMDIEARLNSLKAQEEKVLDFYSKATTIEEMMSIESRLSDLRYQIEYYESSIRNYDLLISYSTLYITINETKVYTPVNTNFFSRLTRSFKNGWLDFTDGVAELIIDFAYNIWKILMLVIFGFIAYRLYKVFKNKKLNK